MSRKKIAFPKNNFVSDSSTKTGSSVNMEDCNVLIFGEIGAWWALSKSDVYSLLTGKGEGDTINFYINSPGGDLIEALVIYDLMKASKANIKVYLTGLVASAATIIACGGDEVIMSETAIYMVHEASIGAWGTKRDLRNQADVLEKYENRAVSIYRKKTSLNDDQIMELLEVESYLEPDEAVVLGFVDSVVDEIEIDFDLSSTTSKSDYYDYYDYWYKADDGGMQGIITNYLKKGVTPFTDEKVTTLLTNKSKSKIKMNTKIFNKQFFTNIFNVLVKGEFIDADKKDAAMKALTEAKVGDDIDMSVIKNFVDEAVKEVETNDEGVGELTAESFSAMLEDATDEEIANIKDKLGLVDDAGNKNTVIHEDVENKIKNLTDEIVKLKTGGRPKSENKSSAVPENKNDQGKAKVNDSKLKMYKAAFQAGNISAEQFEKFTGLKPSAK